MHISLFRLQFQLHHYWAWNGMGHRTRNNQLWHLPGNVLDDNNYWNQLHGRDWWWFQINYIITIIIIIEINIALWIHSRGSKDGGKLSRNKSKLTLRALALLSWKRHYWYSVHGHRRTFCGGFYFGLILRSCKQRTPIEYSFISLLEDASVMSNCRISWNLTSIFAPWGKWVVQ